MHSAAGQPISALRILSDYLERINYVEVFQKMWWHGKKYRRRFVYYYIQLFLYKKYAHPTFTGFSYRINNRPLEWFQYY
jgi:hypothetical protein